MLYVKIRAMTDGADEPIPIGSFLLNEQGKVEVRASSPTGAQALNEILQMCQTEPVEGENGKKYLLPDDPEGWLRALPFVYHGAYMNAELVEE